MIVFLVIFLSRHLSFPVCLYYCICGLSVIRNVQCLSAGYLLFSVSQSSIHSENHHFVNFIRITLKSITVKLLQVQDVN